MNTTIVQALFCAPSAEIQRVAQVAIRMHESNTLPGFIRVHTQPAIKHLHTCSLPLKLSGCRTGGAVAVCALDSLSAALPLRDTFAGNTSRATLACCQNAAIPRCVAWSVCALTISLYIAYQSRPPAC